MIRDKVNIFFSPGIFKPSPIITYIERDFSEGKTCDLIGFMQQDEDAWAEDESIILYQGKNA